MPHDTAILQKKAFSLPLQRKIDLFKARRAPIQLGRVSFASPLILAPMSAICNAPFRLLMEDLGAGGTVSELISCHGINYGNKKTREMLRLDPREENVGIQLFGEDGEAMGEAAAVAESFGPKFIDINMGCPVKKVVTKGAGSSLLKEAQKLPSFLAAIKKRISLPLTIKIRVGWDDNHLNADEIIQIAKGEGVEFVAVHGRTRAQQYTGQARWEYLEGLAQSSPLPLIGNGDLHTPYLVQERLKNTRCQALMLGRGPLRNPFIFLESYSREGDPSFNGHDYFEVVERYLEYLRLHNDHPRIVSVQLRKMVVWFAAGMPGAAQFRGKIFEVEGAEDVLRYTEDYFRSVGEQEKQISMDRPFMNGGHG